MTLDNVSDLLRLLGFTREGNTYSKRYEDADTTLRVDTSNNGYIGYRECGITIGRETTCNLLEPENLVVLQCIDNLLAKGYQPKHLELEPAWRLGHSNKGGFADIWIRTYNEEQLEMESADKQSLCIIECKTWGGEFDGAWSDTLEDGAQLFSYFQQERATRFLCLYTADIIDNAIKQEYRLINVEDNHELLDADDSLKSYSKATNNKELFATWHDTYHCEYATQGLFETDIAPYHIGKRKYSVTDLHSVDNDTIQKKYNEFALILRQHNVGGHENAFDKLVNLFLAKVVDETNNPNDLSFYWKGSAYDDAYRLQDRLQRLYRDGMKRFLNEDVTYIEDGEIEKAFRRFRNDPDATKRTIKEYFRALKFFSDNDFSFISVHNKRLFEQNAAILLKVVKMLQDIRLKDSDQNQLLGDLFEGFLNKGVKQSEGQFFTPMPIVRFLVSSLPLEHLIRDREDIPRAIDYACGAGHFLTEYAVQIEDFVHKYKPDIPINDYYASTTGIEKEYRLSKVSKVSAFMYGHDETNIIYADALAPHPGIKDGTYDVLIANPPYSVKGFLEMLTEQQRKQYSLFSDGINLGKNNAIEAFFIERAAQLLRSGGVAGIILPVSILNKDGIYARAREIILQRFDIIALTEFGSGTFGKTGTNTVTLFLRRKETNTPDSEHYLMRVNAWFGGKHEADEVYDDDELLDAYCGHLKYDLSDYRSMLSGTLTESMSNHETFQSYRDAFLGNGRNAMKGVCEKAKDIRTRFVSRQRSKAFRTQPQALQEKEAETAFLQFVRAIEQEKVYYFLLCSNVTNPVVIVKSPSTSSEIKKFLGYEWSDSKGNEGIKYLNVSVSTNEDDDNDSDDTTMQQIRGIAGINTPLFNPSNLFDSEKINSLIRAAFNGEEVNVPDSLTPYVEVYSLVDLVDFSRPDFNKEIKTAPILSYPKIETKFDSERINSVAPYVTDKMDCSDLDLSSYITTANMLKNRAGVEETTEIPDVDRVTSYQSGDILVSNIRPYLKKIWLANKNGGCSNDVLVFRNAKPTEFITAYLFTIMSMDIFFDYMMVGKKGLKMPRGDKKAIQNFLIPKPPKDIQEKIVDECKAVDDEYNEAGNRLMEINAAIETLFLNAQAQASIPLKLNKSTAFDIQIGQRVLKTEISEEGTFLVFSANVFDPFGRTKQSILSDFSKPSILWGIDGDWMVSYLERDIPFNPTDHCGVIRILDESQVLPRYLTYPLRKAGEHERFSRSNRASTERIKSLTLMLPPMAVQQEVVNQITPLEEESNRLKLLMDNCIMRKQLILNKYLL